jgi:hypothetical protein
MVMGKKEDADVRLLRCPAVLVALTAALLFRQLSKEELDFQDQANGF